LDDLQTDQDAGAMYHEVDRKITRGSTHPTTRLLNPVGAGVNVLDALWALRQV